MSIARNGLRFLAVALVAALPTVVLAQPGAGRGGPGGPGGPGIGAGGFGPGGHPMGPGGGPPCGPLAFGHGAGPGGPPDGAARIEHLSTLLDLSADQKDAIGEIFAAGEAERATRFAAVEEARKALFEAIRVTPVDEAQVRELGAALGAAEAEAALFHVGMHAQVIAVLTPEQAARLDELRAQRGGDGPGGMRRHGFGRHR